MRYIERYEAPAILQEKADDWKRAFLAKRQANPKHRPDSKETYGHEDIRAQLLDQSHHKCYYSEALLDNEPEEIDHWIEIAERPELAFEWRNLYATLSDLNRRKKPNKSIPVTDILDPCRDRNEEIEKHITFEKILSVILVKKGVKVI